MMDKNIAALPKPNAEHRNARRKPITMHYVYRRDMIDGRATFAACGEYMNGLSMKKTEQGKRSGRYIVCPMCELDHERLEQDPEGWAERRYYGDSGDPLREAIRAVSLIGLERADVTIPEAATKAGLNPLNLWHHIMDGNITLGEMTAIADAMGITPSMFIARLESTRRLREAR